MILRRSRSRSHARGRKFLVVHPFVTHQHRRPRHAELRRRPPRIRDHQRRPSQPTRDRRPSVDPAQACRPAEDGAARRTGHRTTSSPPVRSGTNPTVTSAAAPRRPRRRPHQKMIRPQPRPGAGRSPGNPRPAVTTVFLDPRRLRPPTPIHPHLRKLHPRRRHRILGKTSLTQFTADFREA